MHRSFSFLFFGLLFFGHLATASQALPAQSSAGPSAQTAAPLGQIQTSQSPWAGVLQVTTETDLQDDSLNGRPVRTTYEAGLSYRLAGGDSLGVSTAFAQTLVPVESFAIQTLNLNLRSKTHRLTPALTAQPRAAWLAPVNAEAVRETSYRGAIRGSVLLDWGLPRGLKASYRPEARLNNHEFQTTAGGTFNTRSAINQYAGFSVPLRKGVDLSLTGSYMASWNYSGRLATETILDQEISFQLRQGLDLAVGHSNSASGLSADGQSANFDFLNTRGSVVYVSLSATN